MEIKEQSGLRAVLQDVEIPQVYVVRQHFERDGIPDIPAYLHEKLNRGDLKSRIRPGMKVVLTGSSRQIANMPVILRELARFVKDQGGEPYIIPAMGSHGGATAEGQREILESYGITEDFCGCPIFPAWRRFRWAPWPAATRCAWTALPTRRTLSSWWDASRGTPLSGGPMNPGSLK